MKEEEKKELSIMVWDVIFYTEDEDGNPTTDKNGNLIKLAELRR